MIVIVLSRLFGFKFKGKHRGELYRDVAEDLYSAGEYSDLLEFSQKELQRNPKSAIAYWYIGRAHYALGNYEEAENSFNTVTDLDPSWEKEHVQPFIEKIQKHTNK